MRFAVGFVIGLYLGAGLFSGLLMQRAIPALNPVGLTYLAMTWPRQIICARVSSGCSTEPPSWMHSYLFSFPSRADEGEAGR